MLPVLGELRPWTDPAVTSIGRLPIAPPTSAFPSIADARAADPLDATASRWRRSLAGRWDFRLFDRPDAVPASAIGPATIPAASRPGSGRADVGTIQDDGSIRDGGSIQDGWCRVAVPGNWTLQGVVDQHGTPDLPQYTNVRMPFAGPPPSLPPRNPTGVYRRELTVPAGWRGRRIVVHIGGAESVHALYVNGSFAGYGTDSRLASEYDVTDHVGVGRNTIAVVVLRWSAHSYVEDQDQWWMAGLHRQVFVEARAPTHITSVVCDAAYNHVSGAGRLHVRTTVGGSTPPTAGWKVRTTVETLRNRRLAAPATASVPHRFATPYVFTGHHVDVDIDLADVDPWSAESPRRSRVVVELVDPSGTVTEVHSQLVGFRSIEIRDREFTVNGRPIWFFGVNRHDHHPERGKAVTVADMRADLLAMRRHNITAVRTAHYPNDPRLLDLADEIGMYVVDEANIESHAYNTSLCDDPTYRQAWVERVARMVTRDRNHPSVVMWSLGNESGHGVDHAAAAGWIRAADPSRPLHSEGAVFHDGWTDGGRIASDVVCPMYPTIDAIVEYGNDPAGDRPLIMCEYSHAMGNSNGSLADYWDAITTIPGLQGGFIWEWKDHGLTATLPNGRRGFAYGGQFGETVHDGNFVADGLMSADLVPHPAIDEVGWVYRPVTTVAAGRSKLVITNRRSFTDLSDLVATWQLTIAGEVCDSGDLTVGVEPRETVTIALPCTTPTEPDAHLTVQWRQRRATAWAPQGHLVAWDQMELRAPTRRSGRRPSATGATGLAGSMGPKPSPTPSLHRLLGSIEPSLSLVRAPTDNDGFKLMPDLGERLGIGGSALRSWRRAGLGLGLGGDADGDGMDQVGHHHTVETRSDASVVHRHIVTVSDSLADAHLGRIGVEFALPGAFDRLRWFGRGPGENYPDRNRGSLLAIWDSGVDRPPYLVPQEFGLRTDVRWFEFIRSDTGETLRLDVLEPAVLHVSATRYTNAMLTSAEHETDLRPGRRLVVKVDVAHRGLGTASCGPEVLPRYEIPAGRHRFAYRLSAH